MSDLPPNAFSKVFGYTYPVFHDKGKKIYVDFKAFDPAAGELCRKKIHSDSIANPIQHAYQYDKRLVSESLDRLVIVREICPSTANTRGNSIGVSTNAAARSSPLFLHLNIYRGDTRFGGVCPHAVS